MLAGGAADPVAFTVRLLVKDLELCTAEVDGVPAATAALASARRGVEEGRGDEDYAQVAAVVQER